MTIRLISDTEPRNPRLPETPDIMTRATFIHQAMEQWDQSDLSAVAEKVKRLELGLPKEDHFMALATWLGRCALIHKLGQERYPAQVGLGSRVPDLFAVFNSESRSWPVAIEVKSTTKRKLNWRPDYLTSLQDYSSLTGLPVLVACYWEWLGLWTLNDLSCFTQATSNYHLTWDEALKDSLMGVLAGDFRLVLYPGFGIHFECAKLGCEGRDSETGAENWQVQIQRAYLTTGMGDVLEGAESNAGALLWFFPYLEERGCSDQHSLTYSLVVTEENTGMFAQQAVPIYTDGGEVRWSQVLKRHEFPLGENKVRREAITGFNRGIVQCVLDQVPNRWPSWLPREQVKPSVKR